MQGAQAKFSMSAERSGQQDLAGSSGWSDSTKQTRQIEQRSSYAGRLYPAFWQKLVRHDLATVAEVSVGQAPEEL